MLDVNVIYLEQSVPVTNSWRQ